MDLGSTILTAFALWGCKCPPEPGLLRARQSRRYGLCFFLPKLKCSFSSSGVPKTQGCSFSKLKCSFFNKHQFRVKKSEIKPYVDLRAPIEAGRGARGGGSLEERGYYIFGEIGYAGDWRFLSTVRRIAANTGTVSHMVKHKSAPAVQRLNWKE